MRVVVAALSNRCPAAAALEREGVPHIVRVLDDQFGYGRMLTEMWTDEFVLLEHDVVPWVGAVQELRECQAAWCQFPYPFAPNAVRPALGCVKFSDELVHNHPGLADAWSGAEWWQLDGRVIPSVERVAGKSHMHGPPLAHVKGWNLES